MKKLKNSNRIKESLLVASMTVALGVSVGHAQNNTLVLNGAYIVMDGGTAQNPIYLVINQNSPQGIVRNSGHIVSESQYNYVKWVTGTSTGSYVVPFGVGGSGTDYIPVVFDKTSSDDATLQMSTWATDISNNPKPGATNVGPVTSMTGITDSVVYAIDRFWDIRAGNSTTADLTFSYLGSENTTGVPTDNVSAQHWNGNSWDTPVVSGSVGVTSGVGTAGPYVGQNTFSPWVLTVEPACATDSIYYANSSFCEGDDGEYNVTHTDPTLTGTYSVSPSGLALNTTTGEIDVALSAAGTYTVTFTVAATLSCPQLDAMTTVVINPLPTTPVITQTGNILSVNLQQGETAEWFFGGNSIGTGSTATITVDGDYEVVVTNSFGCQSSTIGKFSKVGLAKNSLDNQLSVYPNPTEDNVNIVLKGNEKLESVVVYDALGKEVLNLTSVNSNEQTINLSHFTKGVYMVKINTQNETVSKKIIKK